MRNVKQFWQRTRGLSKPARRWKACKASYIFAVVAQVVEHILGKDEVAGSSPASSSKHALVAQLVEQLICNQQVVGSSPTGSSI